jgi:hypothetical protein
MEERENFNRRYDEQLQQEGGSKFAKRGDKTLSYRQQRTATMRFKICNPMQ